MTPEAYARKEQARRVNLISFLEKEYPDMIEYNRQKQEWRVPDTHIKINESSFFDFDTETGGDNIRFLTDIMNKSFFTAVKELVDADVDEFDINNVSFDNKYEKPIDSGENDRALNYLVERKIERDIAYRYICCGEIYYDERGNIVFYNSEQDFCILRSTYADWKGVRSLKVNGYWEVIYESTKEVYVFEAPIDALSYMTLYKKPGIYIAMGGLKKETLKRIVREYSDRKITLCVDWDEAGNKFCKQFDKLERDTGTIGKDWNDELQGKKEMPQYDLFD